MTKKKRILELFNSIEWDLRGDEFTKTITKDEFERHGFYGDIENSQQHCDLIYARRIIQELGHKVIIGGAFHVWKDKLK